MKIRIKTYNGELPSYLTVGKVYHAHARGHGLFDIIDDSGHEILVNLSKCIYLNGGSWEIINE